MNRSQWRRLGSITMYTASVMTQHFWAEGFLTEWRVPTPPQLNQWSHVCDEGMLSSWGTFAVVSPGEGWSLPGLFAQDLLKKSCMNMKNLLLWMQQLHTAQAHCQWENIYSHMYRKIPLIEYLRLSNWFQRYKNGLDIFLTVNRIFFF